MSLTGSAPTANSSFASTANQPFDCFSGISHRQLDLFKTQWDNVKLAAAAASGMPATEGARIFGREAYYMYVYNNYIIELWYCELFLPRTVSLTFACCSLHLWFPDSAQSIGVSSMSNENRTVGSDWISTGQSEHWLHVLLLKFNSFFQREHYWMPQSIG